MNSRLQILIASYGEDGLRNITNETHPAVAEVEYIVNWQHHGDREVPQELQERKDFRIIRDENCGLCRARNNLLTHATADWIVISDDDVSNTEEHIRSVLKATEENPECAILTFRYESSKKHKEYPDDSFDISQPPKGYFVSSIEMVLNLGKIKSEGSFQDIKLFNPAFGINGDIFCCGEEDILIKRLLKSGFKGKYIPSTIASHHSESTGERLYNTRSFIETKGASFLYLHPLGWPLKMITHALRAEREKGDKRVSFLNYCRWWLSGMHKARKNKVFKEP